MSWAIIKSLPMVTTRRLSVLITIAAVVLWSYSLTQAKLDIGFYGLIHSLPLSFFIALGLLTIASAILWVSKEDHSKILVLQVCLLIIATWLAPQITGGSHANTPEAYYTSGFTDYIIRVGHFDQEVVWYHNWPSTWILCTTIVKALGIKDPSLMISAAPFVLQLLYLPPLYLFLKNTLGESRPNYCWAGTWLFYLGNWVPKSYLHATGLSFLLLLVILALVTKTSLGGKNRIGYGLILIVLFACLTITHLMTSLVGLIIIMALYAVKRVKWPTLVALVAVFIASWMIYETAAFFEGKLPAFVDHAFRAETAYETNIVGRVVGSESHQAVARVMMLTSAIFGVIGLAGAILSLSRGIRKNYADITVLAITGAVLLLTFVMGEAYGSDLASRVFLFLLPCIAYFGVKLLNRRIAAIVLCILLLLLLPLHFVSHYGNEEACYLSPSNIVAWQFFYDKSVPCATIAGGGHLAMMKYQEQYRHVSLEHLHWEGKKLDKLAQDRAFYICIDQHTRALYDFLDDKPQFIDQIQDSLVGTVNCDLIYVNPSLSFYILVIAQKGTVDHSRVPD